MLNTAFFHTDQFWDCLKWGMIVAVWGVVSYGIARDHHRIRRLDAANTIFSLVQLLHHRTLQLWALLSLLIIVDAANDIHHSLQSMPVSIAAVEALPVTQLASAQVQKLEETTSPPKDALIRPPSVANMPYTDITEFNEKDSKEQAYLDWLKERYEGWLVTYYYLHQCARADEKDLALIQASLRKELATNHAAASVEANILTAAQGSYEGLYRDIPCDTEHLTVTKNAYDINMQLLRNSTSHAPSVSGATKP